MKTKDVLKAEIEKKYPGLFFSPYFHFIDDWYDDKDLPRHENFASVTFKFETEEKIEIGRLVFAYDINRETKELRTLQERKFKFMIHERLLPKTLNLLYEGEEINSFINTPVWFQNISHEFFKKVRLPNLFDK